MRVKVINLAFTSIEVQSLFNSGPCKMEITATDAKAVNISHLLNLIVKNPQILPHLTSHYDDTVAH